MDENLKQAKNLFFQITSLCYDLDSELLNEALFSIEEEIKKTKETSDINNAIDEITLFLGDIDNSDSDNVEIVNQINDLITELYEEYL